MVDTLAAVRTVVSNALDLGARGERLDASTPLLGALPELDSMAVMNIIMALEERFDIVIDDDDINASTFLTLGSLSGFVESKLDDRSGDGLPRSESSPANA